MGSFAANPFGLYDLGGNAHEMCEDQWQPDQPKRTGRGGSYGMASSRLLQLSDRSNDAPNIRIHDRGFRCVLDSSATSISTSSPVSTATTATKDTPFTNTLSMKFVPVSGTQVFFCTHLTRVKDYAAFAAETPALNSGWKSLPPGELAASQNECPVANVSWNDARTFCAWLSQKEGRKYRLPTDREWSFAAGIGDQEDASGSMTPKNLSGIMPDKYPWGAGWPPPKGAGNFADEFCAAKRPGTNIIAGYSDGYANRSPVMIFEPNALGLYDMGGNLRQWCEDWYDETKSERVLRGSCWFDQLPEHILSSFRSGFPLYNGRDTEGFRCVLEIGNVAGKN